MREYTLSVRLLRVAVVLMVVLIVPLIACFGYYAMIDSGHALAGIFRVVGAAIGLVALVGLSGVLQKLPGKSGLLGFWSLLAVMALLLMIAAPQLAVWVEQGNRSAVVGVPGVDAPGPVELFRQQDAYQWVGQGKGGQ
ncbi:MAG: hypothetical protein R3E57_06135 [Porticoccaceae bacterium]